MPKINVYLPDELADAVKAADLSVSAVCQRSLEQAVRQVADVRAAAAVDLDAADVQVGLTRFTHRARTVVRLAVEETRLRGVLRVDTTHLFGGLVAEGANMALRVLRAVDVDPAEVEAELAQGRAEPPADADGRRFSAPAAAALRVAVTESISLGHTFVGCEHVLLGLAADPASAVGALLTGRGADLRSLRRAVVATLAGYGHLHATGGRTASPLEDVVRQQLAPVVERLARLERQIGAAVG